MKLKNVVIINDFDYIQGGASKVAIQTAELLQKEGLNVFFFSGSYSPKDHIAGIKYISTKQGESLKSKNKIKGALNNLYNRKAKKELIQLLKTLNPEETIIHYHGWTKCLSSSVFSAAFKMKFKTVLTLHDYFLVCPNGGFYDFKHDKIAELKPWQYLFKNCDSRSYGFQLFRLLRMFIQNKIVKVPKKVDSFIAVSDFSKNIITRNLKKKVNIETILNPIDKLGEKITPDKNGYLLFVGRLEKEKGINLFCEAANKTDSKALVVGDGSLLEDLKKAYPKITFVGWKNREEIYQYMKKSKILVFPSKWYEGMPLTVIEALNIGLPVIANNVCAASDCITPNNGFVFNNSLESLSKILTLLNNKPLKPEAIPIPNNEKYIQEINIYYLNILGGTK